MDREALKEYIAKVGEYVLSKGDLDALPEKFYDAFIVSGVQIEKVEPGRVLCSMKVPPRLVNVYNTLHGGATISLVDCLGSAAILTTGHTTTGVSVEINVSYVSSASAGEEIEIDSRVLRAGKTIVVVSVELRKRGTGEIIAQGRHSKYIAASSKL